MQMPHEGDESDSSSDDGMHPDRNQSYSDADSNDFGHKDSSGYSNAGSFNGADHLDSDTPASGRKND